MSGQASGQVTNAHRAGYVCLAIAVTFPLVVGLTMANVALPAIMLSMGMRLEQAQLLSSGTLLAATISALGASHAWKRFGPRITVTSALGIFLLGSVVSASALSPEMLILGRIAQGAAAGFMQPLSLLLVAPLFPPDRRGTAMGLVGMGMLLAPAVGPIYAGWMVDQFGWRAMFLSLCPWCLACLPFARRMLSGAGGRTDDFDWSGLLLLTTSLGCAMASLALHAQDAKTMADLLLGTSLIAGTCFTARQILNPQALISPGLFARIDFSFCCLVLLVLGFGIFGSVLLVPLFLQTVAGFTPAAAGSVLLPAGIAMALASPVCGHACDRWSPIAMLSIGLAFFSLSSFLLAATAATDSTSVCLWVMLGRIALAIIFPAIYALSLYGLPAAELPQGSSVVNFIRQLGGAFGTALLVVAIGHQEAQWVVSFQDGALADANVLAAQATLAENVASLVHAGDMGGTTSALLGVEVLATARAQAFRDLFLITGWIFAACAALAPVPALWIRARMQRQAATREALQSAASLQLRPWRRSS
ncbi:DHA2 family efflux MFS transporter permease subunit [Lysobacter fragariae]